jgi:hypothetical protein
MGCAVCGGAAVAGFSGVFSFGLFSVELHPAVRIAMLITLRANARRYNFMLRSSQEYFEPISS